MSKRELAAGILVVLSAWSIALLSTVAAHRNAAHVCAQDRVELKQIYAVQVSFADESILSFCNTRCALAYLEASGQTAEKITVRDEKTGNSLNALDAVYVESDVFTHRESESRIHIFADPADAMEHERQFNGDIIPCPFKAEPAR